MGTTQWQELMKVHSNGCIYTLFVDGDGTLVKLPTEFVEALASHSVLDVDVSPSSSNPRLMRIVRSGSEIGVVPLRLLQALAGRRHHETETEIS